MTKKSLGIVALFVLTISFVILFKFRRETPSTPPPSAAQEFPGPNPASTAIAAPTKSPPASHEQVAATPATPLTAETPPEPAARPAHPAIDEFKAWSERFVSLAPGAQAVLLAEGEALAVRRREELQELIRSNPEAALDAAMPMCVRQQLPPAIGQYLEKRVSGRGFFGVLIADNFEAGTREVRRQAVLNGERFQAYVYGPRVTQPTTANIPMYGIAIDNLLALHKDAVRPLEACEDAPLLTGQELCPVSSRRADSYNTKALAEVGSKVEAFCGPAHIQLLNQRLAADAGGSGGDGESGPIPDSWSQGPKTLLFMRVAFPDDPSEPITEDGAYNLMDAVNTWFVENSYDTTYIIPTVTPLLMLPQPRAWYSVQGTDRLLSDSRQAALTQAGLDTDNFNWDIVRHNNVPGFNYGGLAFVRGKGTWLQSSSTGVACHELGHNYGLWHANSWNASADSIIAIGTHSEYGNSFDTMGAANAGSYQFNAAFKNQLDWLPDSFVHNVTSNGTYRIHTYDLPSLVAGQKYSLKVKKNYDRNYWAEFRQKFNNRWFLNGIILNWDPWDNGVTNSAGGTHLLDTTPGTPEGKNDCAVVIGRTFSDAAAGVHFTPVARGNDSPENWIDVVVNVGAFPSNNPPIANITADRTSVPVNGTVNFTAEATDPDGDPLAYYWDFGDLNFGPNSPSVSKGWSAAGEYVVRCTVSDMKGGVFSKHVLITVGAPATFRISGRVTTTSGAPLEGVRVHNGLGGTSYRGAYTDSEGFYVIANSPAANYSISAALYGYNLSRDGWANPVTVGPHATERNWTASPNPFVSIAVTDAVASEAGTNPGRFTITRTGPTNAPLNVRVNRTGTAGTADYSMSPAPSGSPLQFTIPAGASALNVIVTPVNDSSSEGPENAILTLQEDIIYPSYVLGSLAEATLTIVDDEAAVIPSVDVSASTPSSADNLATESGFDTGVFTFTRNGSVAGELTVFYSIGGTATADLDYTALPGVVTIPAGQTVTAVPFTTIDDAEVESNETVVVTILASAAYSGAGDSTTITIVDDDPPRVTVTATDDTAREANGSVAVFAVTRSGSLEGNLVVNYALGGTASNTADYATLSGTLTIPAGRASVTITVTPLNDAVLENNETVTLSLLNSPSYNVGNPGLATVTIVDDEFSTVTLTASDSSAAEPSSNNGSFTFARTGNLAADLTVYFTVNGTARNGADYAAIGESIVIPAGAASVVLPVAVTDDPIRESSETVILMLQEDSTYVRGTETPLTVTISDNDASALPGVGFTVASSSGPESSTAPRLSLTLSASSSSTVTVNFSATGGSALGGGTDYTLASGTVTFAAGVTSRSITNVIVNDSIVESNETVIITLSSPANAQLDANAIHVYTILDDDGHGTVSIAAVDGSASEAGDPGRFRITRSLVNTNELTVNYQVIGSASSPSDYLPLPTAVTIPAGSNFVEVLVQPVDDETDETNETVMVSLTSAPGAKFGTDFATVTILDDDDTADFPIVSLVATDALAAEPGADTGMFAIRRDRNINDPLAVLYTVGGSASSGGDYFAIGTIATIPAGEFETTIVVTPRDDTSFESNETVTATLTLLGTYRAAPQVSSATVTILDDEIGVSIVSAGSAAEDGSNSGAFTISRSGNTSADLTVNFTVAGNAAANFDYVSLGTSIVIPAGSNLVTLVLQPIDDSLAEGSETVVVTLVAGASYSLRAPSAATLIVQDDEPAVSIAAADGNASEPGTDTGSFTLTRTGDTNAPLTVNLNVSGTASNGVDFAAISDEIVIPAGARAVNVVVSPNDDADTEGSETVQLTVLSNAAYAVVAPNSAVVTINDDEVNLGPVVTITSPGTETVFITQLNSMLVLEADISDDGKPNPPGALTFTWTRQSGAGTVTFGNASMANTTARFSANGRYVLRLTASDSELTAVDELTVLVGPVNTVTQGLVAYWHLDETAGQIAVDSSGSNRNATNNGAAWTAGRFFNALDFDAASDSASFSSPALPALTVSAWIYSDSAGNSTTPRVMDMPGYNMRIRRDPSSTQNCLAWESMRSTTAGEWRTDANTILDGNWYHVVAAYDSSGTANDPVFYINGVSQDVTERTAPAGTQTANTGTGYLGNSAALNRNYDGRIDEVRIYNRILLASEVQQLFNGPVYNLAPVVDAGSPQVVTTADQVFLNGIVTDDGRPDPPADTTHVWTKFSGPGTVEFADDQMLATYATFSTPGTYVLRLTADDAQIRIIDEVTLTVLEVPNTTVNVAVTFGPAKEYNVGGSSGASFTVSRSGPTNVPLTIFYETSGTASNGVDYAAVSGAVVISAGAESAPISISPVADNLAEGDESVILILSPNVSYNLGTNASATVTIQDRPWDHWRFSKFTAAELNNPDISGDAADVDLDGLSSLLEYAFNLEPKTADVTRGFSGRIQTNPDDSQDYLVVTFTRRKLPTDLIYEVEATEDFQTWQGGPAHLQGLAPVDDGNGITETASVRILPGVSNNAAGKKFVRLHIIRQPGP